MYTTELRDTDPYGHLFYAIGNADDFVCFDFADAAGNKIRLHAVLNSETGSFIQDFEPPVEVPRDEAVQIAAHLTEQAMDWCSENEIEHDTEGWDQDEYYFKRCVEAHVNKVTVSVKRRVDHA